MLCNVMLRYDVYPMCERVSKKNPKKIKHRVMNTDWCLLLSLLSLLSSPLDSYTCSYTCYTVQQTTIPPLDMHTVCTYWGGMHNGKIRGAHGPHRPVLFFGRLLGVLAADTGLFHFTVFFIRSVEGLRLRLDCLDSSYSRLRSSM